MSPTAWASRSLRRLADLLWGAMEELEDGDTFTSFWRSAALHMEQGWNDVIFANRGLLAWSRVCLPCPSLSPPWSTPLVCLTCPPPIRATIRNVQGNLPWTTKWFRLWTLSASAVIWTSRLVITVILQTLICLRWCPTASPTSLPMSQDFAPSWTRIWTSALLGLF
jgi:hypothetical protein